MSTETKFTPGPWAIGEDHENTRAIEGRNSWSKIHTSLVANVSQWSASKDGSAAGTANAHLIAAAPRLYAALEALERSIGFNEDIVIERCREALAALKEARGEA